MALINSLILVVFLLVVGSVIFSVVTTELYARSRIDRAERCKAKLKSGVVDDDVVNYYSDVLRLPPETVRDLFKRGIVPPDQSQSDA
ncbi:MAG: hypothetical protein AB7L09_02605 [Nitrospira sp.]